MHGMTNCQRSAKTLLLTTSLLLVAACSHQPIGAPCPSMPPVPKALMLPPQNAYLLNNSFQAAPRTPEK